MFYNKYLFQIEELWGHFQIKIRGEKKRQFFIAFFIASHWQQWSAVEALLLQNLSPRERNKKKIHKKKILHNFFFSVPKKNDMSTLVIVVLVNWLHLHAFGFIDSFFLQNRKIHKKILCTEEERHVQSTLVIVVLVNWLLLSGFCCLWEWFTRMTIHKNKKIIHKKILCTEENATYPPPVIVVLVNWLSFYRDVVVCGNGIRGWQWLWLERVGFWCITFSVSEIRLY